MHNLAFVPPPAAPKKVLVVDDDRVWLGVLERVLGREFQVVTATNAMTALKAIRECTPDVVVSDVHMPLMDGLELKDAAGTIPFVIVSGAYDAETVTAAASLGVSEFLEKTGPVEDVIDAAHRAMTATSRRGTSS